MFIAGQEGHVVAIGDLMSDQQFFVKALPTHGGDVSILKQQRHIGGSAANTARALAVLEVAVSLATVVGADSMGESMLENLEQLGVNTKLIQQTDTTSTGFTITMIDQSGERTMASYRGASAIPMTMTASLEAALLDAPMLLVTGYPLLCEDTAAEIIEAVKLAKSGNVPIAFDPSPIVAQIAPDILEQMIDLSDILLPNESEALVISHTESVQEALYQLKQKVATVVIKCGGKGAYISTSGVDEWGTDTFFVPAQEVEVVDTTGAGDAFNGGFIAAFLEGATPSVCLLAGHAVASLAVSHIGASTCYDDAPAVLMAYRRAWSLMS